MLVVDIFFAIVWTSVDKFHLDYDVETRGHLYAVKPTCDCNFFYLWFSLIYCYKLIVLFLLSPSFLFLRGTL